jgi:hypothetical protein
MINPTLEPKGDEREEVINTMEELRVYMLTRGVPLERLANAMNGPVIEHDPAEKKKR